MIHERILNWDQIGLDTGNLVIQQTWDDIDSFIHNPVGIVTWDMEGEVLGKQILHLSNYIRKWKPYMIIVKLYYQDLCIHLVEELETGKTSNQ